jgi:AcrR family transcriptional regulator
MIIEGASSLFAEKGYDAVSMDELARASGTSRPVLYDHFRSKRDLYLTLLKEQRDAILEYVSPNLRTEAPLEDRLRLTINAFFSYVETHSLARRILFSEASADHEIAEAQRRLQSEANAFMGLSLASDPRVRALIDTRGPVVLEVTAQVVGSGLNGLVRWWHERPEVPRELLVNTAMDIFWLGLERILGV